MREISEKKIDELHEKLLMLLRNNRGKYLYREIFQALDRTKKSVEKTHEKDTEE